MSQGIFIPSGARVPLISLPPIDRAIRLPDGRGLHYERCDKVPAGANGEIVEIYFWRGPDGLTVATSLDPTTWGPLLHVSVSYRDIRRRPTWEDITAIKAAIFGDVDACMVLPKHVDYVNMRDNCFHLNQIPERWGIR